MSQVDMLSGGALNLFSRIKSIVMIISFMSMTATAQAPTDIRIALVIGNSAYAGAMALKNPANDAADMSASLKKLGFSVIETKDATRAQMEEAIQKMFNSLKGRSGIGLLYYAGHGLQVDWKNYMVPIDAKLRVAKDVPIQTVDVGDVIEALKAAGSRMNIIVLDACRDNPFTDKGGKGLAPVDAPPGTFLSYATAPGNVAEDGEGKNGLFTKHLLLELEKPVSIENVFKRVRLAVRKESQGRQIPWESTSLEDDFSFAANKVVDTFSPTNKRESDFAEQKTAWDQVKESKNPADFYEFLTKYPGGLISEIAQSRLDILNKTSVIPQGFKGEKAQATTTERLQIGDKWTIRTSEKSKGFFGGVSENSYTMEHSVVAKVGDIFEVRGRGVIKAFYTSRGAIARYEAGMLGPAREFDPPLPKLPQGTFKVGDRSVSRSSVMRNGQKLGEFDADIKVLSRESLTTAMGVFDTYKIERHSTELDVSGRLAKVKWIAWYSPNFLIPLKETVEVPETGYAGTHEIIDLKQLGR